MEGLSVYCGVVRLSPPTETFGRYSTTPTEVDQKQKNKNCTTRGRAPFHGNTLRDGGSSPLRAKVSRSVCERHCTVCHGLLSLTWRVPPERTLSLQIFIFSNPNQVHCTQIWKALVSSHQALYSRQCCRRSQRLRLGLECLMLLSPFPGSPLLLPTWRQHLDHRARSFPFSVPARWSQTVPNIFIWSVALPRCWVHERARWEFRFLLSFFVRFTSYFFLFCSVQSTRPFRVSQ